MSESFKICPICGAANHRSSTQCATCGAGLMAPAQASSVPTSTLQNTGSSYDFHYGETDLLEADMRGTSRRYLTAVVSGLVAFMLVGLVMVAAPSLLSDESGPAIALDVTPTLTRTSLPTVTSGPPTRTPSVTPTPEPTATPTFTPEPCFVTVQANDGLYAVISRCGHIGIGDDLLEAVQATNALSGPQDIRPGDVLEIPWPTQTPDPNALPADPPPEADGDQADTANTNSEGETVVASDPGDEDFDPFFVPTATLQPGIQFHVVQPGEDIISIAVQYGANLEILSQINPEITFSQCDFGEDFGGPRCSVFLSANQRVRVPAPTPTATIPPTPTGSETPTPTPTPTFNAPNLVSPSDRALFGSSELVTLRWIGTGILSADERYRLRVENMTQGIVYTVDTVSNSYVLPLEWQGTEERRFEFTWSVSVINLNTPDTLMFTTETRTLVWEGREP